MRPVAAPGPLASRSHGGFVPGDCPVCNAPWSYSNTCYRCMSRWVSDGASTDANFILAVACAPTAPIKLTRHSEVT